MREYPSRKHKRANNEHANLKTGIKAERRERERAEGEQAIKRRGEATSLVRAINEFEILTTIEIFSTNFKLKYTLQSLH